MAIRKLLLIRGLGNSGTIILDLVLVAHPQMIGLWEALRILRTPLPGEERRAPARLRAEYVTSVCVLVGARRLVALSGALCSIGCQHMIIYPLLRSCASYLVMLIATSPSMTMGSSG